MKNLAEAIVKVMAEVKGIEKNSNIGTGTSAYKGVSDQDVKKIIGDSMAKHGLSILPIGVKSNKEISRWEESYNNGPAKPKQQVFTEVFTEYLLLHTSGESQVIQGYGHGIDSQDKSAGKATTYALKYTLLYLFLVPTGKIDDADNTHSDDIQTPINQAFETIKEEALRFTEKDELIKWANLQTEWAKHKDFVKYINILIAKLK